MNNQSKQTNCQGHDAREQFLPRFAEWLNDTWLSGAVALVRARAAGEDTALLVNQQRELEPLFLAAYDWDGETAGGLADAFNFQDAATADAWERFLFEDAQAAARWASGGYTLDDLTSDAVRALIDQQRRLVAAADSSE